MKFNYTLCYICLKLLGCCIIWSFAAYKLASIIQQWDNKWKFPLQVLKADIKSVLSGDFTSMWKIYLVLQLWKWHLDAALNILIYSKEKQLFNGVVGEDIIWIILSSLRHPLPWDFGRRIRARHGFVLWSLASFWTLVICSWDSFPEAQH